MKYWVDLATVETYEESQKAGSTVAGFRKKRWATCQKVEVGDRLLCYITGISRWAGILRVTKPAFQSDEQIWDMDLFPVRLGVEAEILLPPEHAVPHKSLLASLPSSSSKWSALLRASPSRVPHEDAEVIVEALQRARETPVRRPYDKRKAQHRPRAVGEGERSQDTTDVERPPLCPWLPTYSQARGFLRAAEGIDAPSLAALVATVLGLRGTPQEPMSWDDPDSWIAERLSGEERGLAEHIWTKSGKQVNPRYLRGPMIVADRYGLLEESEAGKWSLTESARDFLDNKFGPTERGIDLQEGMAHILKSLMSRPKSRRSDLVPDWREFVTDNSSIRQDSVVKHFLYHRLQNLIDRTLVERDGLFYRITQQGSEYRHTLASGLPRQEADKTQELLTQVETFNKSQREALKKRLEKMDPFAFEHLVCDLLTEMGYEDVEVTQPSNDKGVDVKAVAQFGITSINEVIQVKRQRRNIQRPILDMLRGSLHRFKAQKGTVITIGDFGKGARDAAFEMGAAPITLINGETLIDLLIQHQIGVKRKSAEYVEIDEQAFSACRFTPIATSAVNPV